MIYNKGEDKMKFLDELKKGNVDGNLFFKEYWKDVFKITRRCCPSASDCETGKIIAVKDYEDFAKELVMKFITNKEILLSYNFKKRFNLWLYVIIKNACYNEWYIKVPISEEEAKLSGAYNFRTKKWKTEIWKPKPHIDILLSTLGKENEEGEEIPFEIEDTKDTTNIDRINTLHKSEQELIFTPEEKIIIDGIKAEKTLKQIAIELNVSEKTAKKRQIKLLAKYKKYFLEQGIPIIIIGFILLLLKPIIFKPERVYYPQKPIYLKHEIKKENPILRFLRNFLKFKKEPKDLKENNWQQIK